MRKAYESAKKDSSLTIIGVTSTVLTAITTSTIITTFAGYFNAIMLAACVGMISAISNEIYRRTIKTTHLIMLSKTGNTKETVKFSPAEMFTSNTAINTHIPSRSSNKVRFFSKHFGLQFIILFVSVSVATSGIFFLFRQEPTIVKTKETTVKVVPDSMVREQTKEAKTLAEKTSTTTNVLEHKVNNVEDKLKKVDNIESKIDNIDRVSVNLEKIEELEKEAKTQSNTIIRLEKQIDDLKKQISELSTRIPLDTSDAAHNAE